MSFEEGNTMTETKTIIKDGVYDEERALYALRSAEVEHCVFAGPADGESALKECRDITVRNCSFSLRYPLWHAERFEMVSSTMDELTRAPVWYAREGKLLDSQIRGIKCLRECEDILVRGCTVVSPEFGWKCRGLKIEQSDITSEYFLFESTGIAIDRLTMKGKYSFQYVENMEIDHSVLDTKDAFWHSKNVTVRNSVVKGEYLGWYSEGLTLENCRIIGTQPLCYCKGLRLIGCTMEGADFAFEYSDVEAEIDGFVESVKNPHAGYILADEYGEIILEHSVMSTDCRIIRRDRKE